jgi:hypothetical protein
MRRLIRTGSTAFPIWSALALAIPVVAFIRISSTPAGLSERVGYSLAQLGYVLLVAGLISGRFGVLGLTSRKQVLMAAVAAWLFGTLLANLNQ